MTPFHHFLTLLESLYERYNLPGLIDLSVGTGMSHLGLVYTLEELRKVISRGEVTPEQHDLLRAYRALLLQLLLNIGADDDSLTTDHLKWVERFVGPVTAPEQPSKIRVDLERFNPTDVLNIIHSAIAASTSQQGN